MESVKDLSKLPLFSSLPKETLTSIIKMLEEERFEAGHLVLKEGDSAASFYILRSGEVEVRKIINRVSGKYKTLAILEEGDVFGEMAICGEELRVTDVIAIKDCLLWKVNFKDFYSLLNADYKVGFHLLKTMMTILLSRLKTTNQELAALYEINKIIFSIQNIEDLTGKVFEQIMGDIKASKAGFMAIWNKFNEEFDICHSMNLPKELHLPLNDPLILKLLKRMSPMRVKEISEIPDLKEKFYSGQSMLVSPMVHNNELIGLIALINPSQKKAFTYSQMFFLSDICTHLALALKNLEREQEDLLKDRLSQKKVPY